MQVSQVAKATGIVRALSVAVVACLVWACAPTPTGSSAESFVVFGDSGYSYEYVPSWYSDVVFESQDAFDGGFQAYWESVKKAKLPDYQVPPAYYHEELGGYIHASGLPSVSNDMRRFCQSGNCAFGVMLGDNIYPDGATLGADGRDDVGRFEALLSRPFSTIADHDSDFVIYSILGNHDWGTSREGAKLQLDYLAAHPRFYIDGLYYSAKPDAFDGDVELFFINTDVLLAEEAIPANALDADGVPIDTGEIDHSPAWVKPQDDYERGMLAWLETSLKESTARWKFVFGHHPMWSSGGSKYQENKVTRQLLLPVLCRYADAYFAGHEHTLEIHSDSCDTSDTDRKPLLHVVSGAAARMSAVNKAFMAYQSRSYPQFEPLYVRGMVWGYVTVTVHGNAATLSVVEVSSGDNGPTQQIAFEHSIESMLDR